MKSTYAINGARKAHALMCSCAHAFLSCEGHVLTKAQASMSPRLHVSMRSQPPWQKLESGAGVVEGTRNGHVSTTNLVSHLSVHSRECAFTCGISVGMRGGVENSGVHQGRNHAASSSLAALPCFAEEAEAEEGDWEEAEAEEERDSSSEAEAEEEEQGEEPRAFFFLDLQKKI